jgi:hypothetical protein
LWYRQRVLDPRAMKSPAEWAWLPSIAEMNKMNVAELLAMRDRAAAQIAPAPANRSEGT